MSAEVMEKNIELKSGVSRVFTNPDADAAREYFRGKSRALKPKLATVEEVVRTMIGDGDYIAIGGFGANRILQPSATRSSGRERKAWVSRPYLDARLPDSFGRGGVQPVRYRLYHRARGARTLPQRASVH